MRRSRSSVEREDRRGVWAIDTVDRGASVDCARGRRRARRRHGRPTARSVIYNVIASNRSNLDHRRREITSNEDVFPFRAQWISPDRGLIYTADGKIKTRGVQGGDAVPIEFTAAISFTRTPYKHATRDFDARTPRPVRGIMAPVISPDGTQVAFAALGDLWLMPMASGRRAAPIDQRSIRGDASDLVAGRPVDCAYSSDRDGSMDLWVRESAERRGQKDRAGASKASWAPRGNEIAYINARGRAGDYRS